jgi:hypothetical protein
MAAALIFIVGLVAAMQSIKKNIKTSLESLLKDKFDEVGKRQDDKFNDIEKTLNEIKVAQNEVKQQMDDVDLENCKNYLVTYLADVRRGEVKDETETQRFWEEYEHYQKKGGNSYIRHSVEDLQSKKLL